MAEVDGFLRLLAVREYSPNTIRAYAHDLQKLFAFLGEAGIAAAEFTPARAVEFLQWLRLVSSSRRAQRLELGVASGGGRVLSAKTCNRVMAAVSSFYEFLIASEAYAGRDNPIVKVADQAAARVPGRYRPPLDNASRQQPVRRVLRVKTVEALPRPMSAEVYAALLGELRTRRDRALLEVMWEGGLRPARCWACGWRTSPTGSGGLPSASAMTTRGRCGRSRAGTGSSTCWRAARCPR